MPTRKRAFEVRALHKGVVTNLDLDAESPGKAAITLAENLIGKAPDLNGNHRLEVTVEEAGKEAALYDVTRWAGSTFWKAVKRKEEVPKDPTELYTTEFLNDR